MKLLLDECLSRNSRIICLDMNATPFLKQVGQGGKTASCCFWRRSLGFSSF